jgi:ubiquinone/menaquinone biosynthesis C-methylase UbiE
MDPRREELLRIYRKKARHYDLTSRLYPLPGYPVQTQRRRAIHALGLRPGDTVVDLACGTGLNFPMIEDLIGPDGRIIGVDMTDAMLAQARRRIDSHGWRNVALVQSDASEFHFPSRADAILSTYALTQVPECAAVIARAAACLDCGGRLAVLDVKLPAVAPAWLTRLGTAAVRPFASIDEWLARRTWETIRAAVQAELCDPSWTELAFGTAFLAVGVRGT